MNTSDNHADSWGLWFDVRRSIRYHDRRLAWFQRIGRWSRFLTIFTASGGIVATLLENHDTVAVACGVATAFLAAVVLAFDVSERALLHATLKMKFVDLAGEIDAVGWENLTTTQLAAFKTQRAKIERNEPPVLHYLNVVCHNELCAADGLEKDEQYKLEWWQKCFAQLIYGDPTLFAQA